MVITLPLDAALNDGAAEAVRSLARSMATASIQRRPSCHSRNTQPAWTSFGDMGKLEACSKVASSWR